MALAVLTGTAVLDQNFARDVEELICGSGGSLPFGPRHLQFCDC